MHSTTLRVGFVPGVEPDRFLRRWKSGRRDAWLELVPTPLSRQHEALSSGEVDMCFVRLPLEDPALHLVPLWEERAAIVVSTDNVLSLLDEVGPEDLAEEPEIPAAHADDAAERIGVVATGIGYTRVPLSLARLHHRKDAVARPLREGEPTRIALAWPRAADDPLRQEFVGVVRGRTARSSR
ncbi:LysR substrate-binding domain-containing protein [Brachybacterium saurashtrense]|uniref:LysR family transcriptional regulator n=1 Tax=Brachybacterium saurashtrense TaxID=556288 RepID=A0A345YLR5_9MICO|nr:LysR substrate-binding domain-containing protein [Brachybacterium saurashtrense]AXK44867.1 LysR family transcriptional regulator [Brachybacterium saurashtrense]RRR20852.1 LysR family transcriptional regulator [Brachybacterium saurashtrense]